MGNEIKFRWVGRNRKFGDIQINSDLTTAKLLDGSVQSFFNVSNRGESGNCEFLSEDLFTGLQDKNGKDIYVGDIVCGFGGKKGYAVKFNNGSFEWKNEPLGWDLDYEPTPEPYDPRKWAVVIGNIYENPELLK